MNRKMFVLFMLKPMHGIEYFVHYYRWIEQIWLFRNWKIITLVKLINSLMALLSVHTLYLALCKSNTALERAIHFDALSLMIGKEQINFVGFLASLLYLYYNYKLYLTTNYPLVRLLYPVIVYNDWASFFIRNKWNNHDVCAQTRKCYLLVLNLFICAIAVFEIMCIVSLMYFNWTLVSILMQSETKSFWFALFCITVCNLNGLIFGLVFVNFGHSLAINFSCTVSLLMMFYLKIQQNFAILVKIGLVSAFEKRLFPLRRYIQFRQTFVHGLQFVFALNRFHGKLFCAFLITHVPINLIFTMWIIQGKLQLSSKLIIYSWMAYICIVLFVFHCIFTQCTAHIHRPTKVLFSLIVRRNSAQSLAIRSRVHIASFLAALNTTKRYGFTYAGFGLVSLNAFSKFLLLYGEYCIMSYNLMKKRIIE